MIKINTGSLEHSCEQCGDYERCAGKFDECTGFIPGDNYVFDYAYELQNRIMEQVTQLEYLRYVNKAKGTLFMPDESRGKYFLLDRAALTILLATDRSYTSSNADLMKKMLAINKNFSGKRIVKQENTFTFIGVMVTTDGYEYLMKDEVSGEFEVWTHLNFKELR